MKCRPLLSALQLMEALSARSILIAHLSEAAGILSKYQTEPVHNPDEFRIFYNQTIHPELMRLDKLRRRMLRRIFLSLVLMAGIAGLLYLVHILVIALVSAIPFVIYIYYQFGQIKKFKQRFKPRVVELILDFIDDDLLFGDLKYDAKRMITKDKFFRSNIFGARPAIYEGEDFIEGRIGDVEFEMSELHVEEFSKVRSRLDLVFKGIFVRAKFFHPLNGALLVLPRNRLPYISNALKSFIRKNGKPMDPFVRHRKFLDIYTVYGSANTKVYRSQKTNTEELLPRVDDMLPRQLMDFILKARERTGEIYLSIDKENCYVAVSNEKDILEPKIFQSNVSFDLVKEFYDDIYVALYIVRELDLAH